MEGGRVEGGRVGRGRVGLGLEGDDAHEKFACLSQSFLDSTF